ncbi:MAG: hypothetical protein M3410_10060 [Acidobacteriota bacterium]|nr:hypothetical protein [Acidobacteriota bacterium]
MRPIKSFLAAVLIVVAAFSSAWSQTGEKVGSQVPDSSQPKQTSDVGETNGARTTAAESPEEAAIWIDLVDGRRVQVDELTENADGFWYKRGNISTFLERARVARVERVSATRPIALTDASSGSSTWRISESAKVESFFRAKFGRSLPLGAFGQSYLHTRWGLDHRNGMDVSLHPDSPHGRALINFLKTEGIPYLAFRGPIPGVSTGPHIHVGNRSPKFSGRK